MRIGFKGVSMKVSRITFEVDCLQEDTESVLEGLLDFFGEYDGPLYKNASPLVKVVDVGEVCDEAVFFQYE
jgi:hypothetical protein